MKADAGGSRTARSLRDRGSLEFQPATKGGDTLSGARACGDSPGDRRRAEIGEQGLITAERIRFFRVGLRTQAATFEQSGDAADDLVRHPGDFRVIRREQAVESKPAGSILGVDSVEDERMEMDVNVEGTAESLHEGHGPALPVADAALTAGSPAQRREDRAHEDLKDVPHQCRVIGQAVAQVDGKREDPLAHWDIREDPIDEMGGGVGHAPAAAGTADSTTLTRVSDDPILATRLAVNPKKAPREHAAVEEGAQFAFDETGHGAVTVALPGEEGLEVGGDDAVERVCLRVTGTVGNGRLADECGGTQGRVRDRQ